MPSRIGQTFLRKFTSSWHFDIFYIWAVILPRQYSLSFPHCQTSRKNGRRLDNTRLNRYAVRCFCYNVTMQLKLRRRHFRCHGLWPTCILIVKSGNFWWNLFQVFAVNICPHNHQYHHPWSDGGTFSKSLKCFNSFPIHLHLNPFCRIFFSNDFNSNKLCVLFMSITILMFETTCHKGNRPCTMRTMCTLMQLFRWTRKLLQRSASERLSQPLRKSHQSQFYIFCPG